MFFLKHIQGKAFAFHLDLEHPHLFHFHPWSNKTCPQIALWNLSQAIAQHSRDFDQYQEQTKHQGWVSGLKDFQWQQSFCSLLRCIPHFQFFGNGSFVKLLEKFLIISHVVCATTVYEPAYRCVFARKTCGNKQLFFMLLSSSCSLSIWPNWPQLLHLTSGLHQHLCGWWFFFCNEGNVDELLSYSFCYCFTCCSSCFSFCLYQYHCFVI